MFGVPNPHMAVARPKGSTAQPQPVTQMGHPFFAEKPTIEFMVEEMAKAFPQNEYSVVSVNIKPKQ